MCVCVCLTHIILAVGLLLFVCLCVVLIAACFCRCYLSQQIIVRNHSMLTFGGFSAGMITFVLLLEPGRYKQQVPLLAARACEETPSTV